MGEAFEPAIEIQVMRKALIIECPSRGDRFENPIASHQIRGGFAYRREDACSDASQHRGAYHAGIETDFSLYGAVQNVRANLAPNVRTGAAPGMMQKRYIAA
jgi:hypothetical protein